MRKPRSATIIGKKFKFKYVKDSREVLDETDSLMGCVLYKEQLIKVTEGGYSKEEVFSTILHELLHAISHDMSLCLNEECNHKDLNTLATLLADTFIRNRWITLEDWDKK